MNAERELQVIQYIIGQGIEREELRDEIFVQCMRQATNNPHSEWTDRIWLLLCLAIVAFQPSKLLIRYESLISTFSSINFSLNVPILKILLNCRYFASFLKKNLETLDGKLRQYVQWCLDNCKYTKVSPRQYPPSSVEVAVRIDIFAFTKKTHQLSFSQTFQTSSYISHSHFYSSTVIFLHSFK